MWGEGRSQASICQETYVVRPSRSSLRPVTADASVLARSSFHGSPKGNARSCWACAAWPPVCFRPAIGRG